jgi:acetyl esterase/lipase
MELTVAGSVDEHRYQMQRHARKLKARVFAPRYRLAPQFPFPCGLQDCLAAYLYLLTVVEPTSIVLAGDSAGGGMVVSMLVTLRDQGVPLPAGAVLISPWVDLTHSFPSVAGGNPFDYIPQAGFHHKPSEAWPPPDEEELEVIKKVVMEQKKNDDDKKEGGGGDGDGDGDVVPTMQDVAEKTHCLSLVIDGKTIEVKEQIQMYTTNNLLAHPLVSPVMQASLGGLPPLLIMVGGGEILRDEQIYLAHKCANPEKYLPPEHLMNEKTWEEIRKYNPTNVQLQVWDDLCHVAPTLSFTRPAKYMYRSVAQFGAWALARAQKTAIDIPDDDNISVISGSGSDQDEREEKQTAADVVETDAGREKQTVGRAGDSLPPFTNHMIRQRVTRHGDILPLPEPEDLPGCMMDRNMVGVIKQGPVKKWLGQKQRWDSKFKTVKAKIHEKRVRDARAGFESFGQGEMPPPSALAGRRLIGGKLMKEKKVRKSLGLAMWAGWGSKHDEMTVERERVAEEKEVKEEKEVQVEKSDEEKEADGTKSLDVTTPTTERDGRSGAKQPGELSRSRSRNRTVTDQNQTGSRDDYDAEGEPVEPTSGLLSPDIGVTGKRPRVDGIAMPFSIKKEADTASMITLNSGKQSRYTATSRPMSPVSMVAGPGSEGGAETPGLERPGLETFVTAAEDLPKVDKTDA